MAPDRKDSRSSSSTSNVAHGHGWRVLGAACSEFSHSPAGHRAVQEILDHALRATGTERAFLVQDRGDEARSFELRCVRSRRSDGSRSPSRTVLLRALAGRRPQLFADASNDTRLEEGASVRSLELRFVVSAPVPTGTPRSRAAVILDSRCAPHLGPREARDVLRAFAGLLSLCLHRPAGAVAADDACATDPKDPPSAWVGRSRIFRELNERTARFSHWPLPVLVTGESGSGKEGVARRLHALGPRSRGPFVAVNCSAITDTLLESELFGAVRGAYTGLDRDRPGLFRLAHRGTLFLDEIGDMPHPMQAKLLRVLQESRVRPVGGESEIAVDVRVVAATHRDLERRIDDGRFRRDLYYRLAVLLLHTPALRERREDIPALASHLGAKLARRAGRRPPQWCESAVEALVGHSWPGNVRELEAVVARALVRCRGDRIRIGDLDVPHGEQRADGMECRMIEAALRRADGVVSRAADHIGWTRQKLIRRMAALGIRKKAPKDPGPAE